MVAASVRRLIGYVFSQFGLVHDVLYRHACARETSTFAPVLRAVADGGVAIVSVDKSSEVAQFRFHTSVADVKTVA